jgi:hypothetical protein
MPKSTGIVDTGDPNHWGEFLSANIENRKLPFPSPSANLVGVWEDREEMLILLTAGLRHSLCFTIGESLSERIPRCQRRGKRADRKIILFPIILFPKDRRFSAVHCGELQLSNSLVFNSHLILVKLCFTKAFATRRSFP